MAGRAIISPRRENVGSLPLYRLTVRYITRVLMYAELCKVNFVTAITNGLDVTGITYLRYY